MRKSILSFAAFFLFISFLHSQSITPYINNSIGGSFKVDYKNFYVDWNVGEMTLVNTMTSSGYYGLYVLTNGLLQPEDKFSKDGDHGDDGEDKNINFTTGDIKVFPNPAVNYVEVDFFINETGKVRLSLFNTMGEQVYTKEIFISGKGRTERIPMGGYTQGAYMLYIQMDTTAGNTKKQGVFKIVKTN